MCSHRVRSGVTIILCTENSDRTYSAENSESPLPCDILQEVFQWKKSGLSIEDIISRLRPRTVPAGYSFHKWKSGNDYFCVCTFNVRINILVVFMIMHCYSGESETIPDKLRSIMAQFEFRRTVRYWDKCGIPFSTFLYVPEVHPVLGTEFHEREDEGHVFKV